MKEYKALINTTGRSTGPIVEVRIRAANQPAAQALLEMQYGKKALVAPPYSVN